MTTMAVFRGFSGSRFRTSTDQRQYSTSCTSLRSASPASFLSTITPSVRLPVSISVIRRSQFGPVLFTSYGGGIPTQRIVSPKAVISAQTQPDKIKPTPQWQGAKPIPMIISLAAGLILRFVLAKPEAVTMQAWQLLSIFFSTIVGLVLAPLPVGAWAFLGLTATVITKTLSFTTAFSAFTNEVLWLIVISFFFARGFVKTGLGGRIATYFVKWLGKSTLGLSYGLTLSEGLIAPAMPSTTARAGGVFLPIISSLALASGSKPFDKSSKRLGAYLVQCQFQLPECRSSGGMLECVDLLNRQKAQIMSFGNTIQSFTLCYPEVFVNSLDHASSIRVHNFQQIPYYRWVAFNSGIDNAGHNPEALQTFIYP